MGWTVDDMLALGKRHAELEARCDLDGLMKTLVADPVYEFHPVGLGMSGGECVRRYYTELFTSFIPATTGYTLLDEWVNESAVVQEYEIELEISGKPESHRVIGILVRSGELLGGERVYASERCIQLMTGKLFDDLEPL